MLDDELLELEDDELLLDALLEELELLDDELELLEDELLELELEDDELLLVLPPQAAKLNMAPNAMTRKGNRNPESII